MGEIAEMILEGTMCQYCGVIMGDVTDEDYESPGYPRTCAACEEDEEEADDE